MSQSQHPKLSAPIQIRHSTHEMGHALSMAHPPGESTLSIMVQGVKTDYSIQLYDRLSLQQKWGK